MTHEPEQDSVTIPWDQGGVLPGFSLSPSQQAAVHKRLGRDLPPEAYRDHLTGHRILVAPDPVSETWGGGLLHKPCGTQEREQMEIGSGWVVAVGPLVGAQGAPHPVGALCRHPADLLGRHVLYQQFAGTNIKTNQTDEEFGGKHALLVLTDRDVMQVSAFDTEMKP